MRRAAIANQFRRLAALIAGTGDPAGSEFRARPGAGAEGRRCSAAPGVVG